MHFFCGNIPDMKKWFFLPVKKIFVSSSIGGELLDGEEKRSQEPEMEF